MRKYENYCVSCPSEIGCLGRSCPYVDVPVDYCDVCGREGATYRIDGEDYCEECAKRYFEDLFSDMTIMEMAEAFGVYIYQIND